MLVSAQIRSARAALEWTAVDLGKAAGIAARTVLRIEAEQDIPQTTTSTLSKIKAALEAAGIEFIGSPSDGPGIRIHRPDHTDNV